MFLRLLNLALLIVALIGGYFALQAGREQRRLLAEHRQLRAEVGLLNVEDPHKVHFLALETDDPLHFVWQMYVPANFSEKWHVKYGSGSSGGSSGGGSSEPYFDLARVRFRQRPDGQWAAWLKRRSASTLRSFSGEEAKLLDQPQSLAVEQLGRGKTAVVDPTQVVTLLRITAPDSPKNRPFIEIKFKFGSREAFETQQGP